MKTYQQIKDEVNAATTRSKSYEDIKKGVKERKYSVGPVDMDRPSAQIAEEYNQAVEKMANEGRSYETIVLGRKVKNKEKEKAGYQSEWEQLGGTERWQEIVPLLEYEYNEEERAKLLQEYEQMNAVYEKISNAQKEIDAMNNEKQAWQKKNYMALDYQEFQTWDEADQEKMKEFVAHSNSLGIADDAYHHNLANALKKKYGNDTFTRIAETIRMITAMEADKEAAAAGAGAKGFWGTVGSLPAGWLGGITGTGNALLGTLGDALGAGTGRYGAELHSSGNYLSNWAESVQAATAKDAKDKTQKFAEAIGLSQDAQNALGNIASGSYQVIVGAADNLAKAVLTGGVGTLALAATSSFSQAYREAASNGATSAQAAGMGLISGFLEVATEKLPLDNLMENLAKADAKTWGQILKQAAAQGGIEMTTEELNFLGGVLAEAAILREKSDYNRMVQQGVASGLSQEEAVRQADMQMIKAAGEVAVQSFFTGALMSGGGDVLNKVTNSAGSTNLLQTQAKSYQQIKEELRSKPQKAPASPQEAQTQGAATNTKVENPSFVSPPTSVSEAVERVVFGDPLGEAMVSLRDKGTISNKAAEKILDYKPALKILQERTGANVDNMTVAQKRAAVKDAVKVLYEQTQTKPETEVDSANAAQYDNNTTQGGIINGTGLQQNDGAGSFGNPAQGMAGVQQPDGAEYQGRQQLGGMAVDSGVVRVSTKLADAQSKRGTPVYPVVNTTATPQRYEQSLAEGRNSDPKNGWCVTPKTTAELAEENIRTFMNEDGTAGFGIAQNGDIVAVFKNRNGGPKKALNTLMPIAIEQGGDRLDCYGEGLVGVYAQYGFIPVARVEFNPEYANDGWTPDKGTPYIYFMMHNGDSASVVAEKMGTYPQIAQEQLNELPTYGKDDYDEAMAYRDSLANGDDQKSVPPQESGSNDHNYGDNTTGAAQSRFRHEVRKSKQYTNTYARATDEAVRDVGEQAKTQNPNIENYDYLSEEESLYNAKLRTRTARERGTEYTALMKKDGWTSEDNDVAYILLKALQRKGDVEKFKKLAQKQREQMTQGGQLIQSNAKYTRDATKVAADAIERLDSLRDDQVKPNTYTTAAEKIQTKEGRQAKFDAWKKRVGETILEIATAIENTPEGDVEAMREHVRQLAKHRKTTAWFGMKTRLTKIAEKALQTVDYETAKDIVLAQLRQFPEDFVKRPKGKIIKTLRVQNMLGSLSTVNRNLAGNATIGIVDALSDSVVGRLVDIAVAKATGKRTVGNDLVQAGAYFKGGAEAAKMAALATELDIPLESESAYSTGSTRTFSPQGKGPVARYLSAFEKALRYALEVTDSFFAGATESAVEASLKKLDESIGTTESGTSGSGLTDADIEAIAKASGERRTFKEDRMLAKAAGGVKKGFNKIGTENIGAGDLVMPFARTGSNVTQTAIDYGSAGLTGIFDVFKLFYDIKMGNFDAEGIKNKGKPGEITLAEAQRRAVTNAGRGITGIGLIALFTALAHAGVLKVHEDEDYDKNALEDAAGLSGAQINLSALFRSENGESAQWREGDVVIGMDFLEPFNAQMYIGYELSQEGEVGDMLAKYPQSAISGIWKSVLDMPMMQGLSDAVNIAQSDDPVDATGRLAGNVLSGFIPATVRQTAQLLDPYYRDTSSDSVWGKALNQVFSAVPGLSTLLPEKYSGLGEEQKRYENLALGLFETYVDPGDIKTISPNAIVEYLRALSAETGSAAIYPDRQAPKSFSYKDKDGKVVTVDVSGKEKTETYQKRYGEAIAEIYSDLIQKDDFNSLDAETQTKILESAKAYATKVARSAVSGFDDLPEYVQERPKGMSVAEAIMRQALMGDASRYADIPISQAVYITEVLKALQDKPRETKEDGTKYTSVRTVQKVEAVAGSKLTDKQQKEVYEDLLDEKTYQKYLAVLKEGFDNDQFAKSYRINSDTEGGKNKVIQKLAQEMGITYATAKTLYDIYNPPKEK